MTLRVRLFPDETDVVGLGMLGRLTRWAPPACQTLWNDGLLPKTTVIPRLRLSRDRAGAAPGLVDSLASDGVASQALRWRSPSDRHLNSGRAELTGT